MNFRSLRNLPVRHKARNYCKGISSVITTIIISGTLLTILVVASFVASNLLELQIASTEFEQAKTNMLLLDEVIQDVALRPGSGGYVPFNQRSGGIGIANSLQKIRILGPGEPTVVTNSPSSPSAGTWASPENAYQSDNEYASTSTDGAMQQYGNYRFNIPSDASIIMVEIGYEAYTLGNEKISLTCSWDGGTTWTQERESSNSLPSSDSNDTTWEDFSSDASWTPEKMSDANFCVRVKSVKVGGMSTIYLDWVPVKVIYVPLSSIYESPPLVSLVYRGGSKVSGADTLLKGSDSLIVDMTGSISYSRIETGNGIQIKLDYNRVRIVEMGEVEGANRIVVTFLRLVKGNTGGSGTVNVKAQNIGLYQKAITYPPGNIAIIVESFLDGTVQRSSTSIGSDASETVIIFIEIVVQISIS